MSFFKWIISIPFYGIGLFIGFIFELIKELKANGMLDDIKPMDFKEGVKASKENSKAFFEEIKSETK